MHYSDVIHCFADQSRFRTTQYSDCLLFSEPVWCSSQTSEKVWVTEVTLVEHDKSYENLPKNKAPLYQIIQGSMSPTLHITGNSCSRVGTCMAFLVQV